MKIEKDKFIWNQVIVNTAYMNEKRKRRKYKQKSILGCNNGNQQPQVLYKLKP